MSPSASSGLETLPTQFVLIGNPGKRRANMFEQALQRSGHPPARLVSYSDLIAGRVGLSDLVTPGAVVRIDSPERDFAVEQAILALGADAHDEDGDYARLPREAVAALEFDNGAILLPRQWYLGYCAVLRLIERQLDECPPHRMMNSPDDIAVMFDKPRCHSLLATNGIPVPRSLGTVRSYDELIEQMREGGFSRVFVKLAHGSSASGVVAYQVSGERHLATTTVQMVQRADGLRLYNSRRLSAYRDQREIATLLDELCRHRVQVEEWLPKAGLGNRILDLRVVVIAGRVQHVVVRLSHTTLTNLHLDNNRAGLDVLAGRLTVAAWDAARASCERTMTLFPNSLYAGIDLLLSTDYRRHAIAEVNAFGDLLLDTVHEGRDTYEAEIEAMRNA